MTAFGASPHMVQKSREVRKRFGIVPEVPHMSKGKVITQEMKESIKTFFESDEVSCACSGIKDCKTVKLDKGEKMTMQTHSVLMNLKEVYEMFKEDQNNLNIGFSTFAALCPPY